MSRDRHAGWKRRMSSTRSFAGGLAAAILMVGPIMADDAVPGSKNGRYTMSPTSGGVIRLDTRTGAISVCNNSTDAGWACYAVPDERAALDAEIGRLQSENDRLKTQLASREQSVTGKVDEALPKEQILPKDQTLPKADQLPKADAKPKDGAKAEQRSNDGTRKLEIPLPSDADIDRMMGLAEQAWRRLLDMANRVQRDVSGRI